MNKSKFRLLRILKVIGITLAGLSFLFVIVVWVILKEKDEWLLNQIQTYVNESQSGQLKIVSIDFKLFRSFPDVSMNCLGGKEAK